MATENVKLKVDVETGQAAKSLSDLKKEFRDLQTQLSNTKVGTKEYADTLKKLGETKDDIGDLKDQITALGSNAAKFQAVGKVVQGVAGGFAAASSAAALFGGEAEEVQKAMLKVQAALALQQGISAILELGDAFKALKLVLLANPIFTIAAILAAVIGYFVGLESIIGGVKDGFKALGEIVSQAFDAIVDGVLYAIDLYTQYLDLLTFGLFDINGAYTDYIDNIEEANRKERERIEALTLEIEKSKEIIKTLNEQIEANERAIKAIDEREQAVVKAYDKEIELAAAAGQNTEQLEKDKLEFVRESLQEKLKLQIKSFEDTKALAAEELKLSETLLERNQGYDKLFATALKQSNNKRVTESKATLDKLKQQIDDNAQAILVKEAETEKERQDKAKEAYEARLKADEEYLKNKKALEDLYAEEDRKFREQAGKEYLELLKGLKEEEVAINLDVLDQVLAANEEYAVKETDNIVQQSAYDKQAAEQRIALATGTLNTLASLTELFGKKNEANAKKAFEINKALNIASALVQTYQSATGAYASQISIPTPDAPIRAAIAAGIAIASGLANVAKIASTQFTSTSGSGSASTPSAPSVNAPSSQGGNSIGTTLLNRQAIEQGQQPTENRVYVVESDMTSVQQRIGGIRNRATVVE